MSVALNLFKVAWHTWRNWGILESWKLFPEDVPVALRLRITAVLLSQFLNKSFISSVNELHFQVCLSFVPNSVIKTKPKFLASSTFCSHQTFETKRRSFAWKSRFWAARCGKTDKHFSPTTTKKIAHFKSGKLCKLMDLLMAFFAHFFLVKSWVLTDIAG